MIRNTEDAKKLDCKIKRDSGKCTAEGCMHWIAMVSANEAHGTPGWGECDALNRLEFYNEGFREGLVTYAHNKDGVQVVGVNDVPLSDALNNVEALWNYNPPKVVVR